MYDLRLSQQYIQPKVLQPSKSIFIKGQAFANFFRATTKLTQAEGKRRNELANYTEHNNQSKNWLQTCPQGSQINCFLINIFLTSL